MAIEETDTPTGTVGAQDDTPSGTDAGSSFSVDDFRLRLDLPLFHRDPGMVAVHVPELRELTWEHVIRPTEALPGADIEESRDATPPSAARQRFEREPRLPSLAPVEPVEVASLTDVLSRTPAQPTDDPESLVASLLADGLRPLHLDPVDEPVAGAVEQPVLDEVTVAERAQEALAVDERAQVELAAAEFVVDDVAVEEIAAEEMAAEEMSAEEMAAEAVAVEDVRVEVLATESPLVVDMPPVPARRSSEPTPAGGIEAELNRLAFLPDSAEEVGPISMPTIVYSDQRTPPRQPALSQHEMYSPKHSAPVAKRKPVAVEAAPRLAAPVRRRKRKLVGPLFTLLLVLALLGGGVFAAKYYLLDQRWAGEVKPLVEAVEDARGLSFDHPLTVTSLPVAEYATKLATVSLGLAEESSAATAAEWRSLGLLSGDLDVRAIGMAAMPDSPAFYDPGSDIVYVVDALPPDLYRFGMHRALTLALLDQNFSWSDRVKDASPSVALGTRAFYDADAVATAVRMAEEAGSASDVFTQIFGLYGAYQIAASPSPFASTVAGKLGVAARPFVESLEPDELLAIQESRTVSDDQVLDVRRLLTGTSAEAGGQVRGMLYWYHVLAGRIDENTAWQAALAWQNDDLSVTSGATGTCVVAHIRVDPASLQSAQAAFQAWAAAAPAGSGTSVTLAAESASMQLDINACDPGIEVPTNAGRGYLALGGAPLRAEQYRLLLEAQPSLSRVQAACAVFGDDSVSSADERGVIDNGDVWPAPAAHPAPDPNRLGCAPAA